MNIHIVNRLTDLPLAPLGGWQVGRLATCLTCQIVSASWQVSASQQIADENER